MAKEFWDIRRLLTWTDEYFSGKAITSSRLDAELLLAHILGKDRIFLYCNHDRPMSDAELATYRALVVRRAKHEPLAYILGRREFFRLEFQVSADVLIPRPETEILVEQVLSFIKDRLDVQLLDIGTGSGAIAVSIAKNCACAHVDALDISNPALAVARANATRHDVADRVRFIHSNWFVAIEHEKYDVIISNPPYIPLCDAPQLQPELSYEPQNALYVDDDGLSSYRAILDDAHRYIKPHGRVYLEVGQHQAVAVAAIAHEVGNYGGVQFVKDYAGIDRVLIIDGK